MEGQAPEGATSTSSATATAREASQLMARKARSKRQPDGELTTGRWEAYLANQQALEQALGPAGAAEARARAEALVEGGWAAAWPVID